MNKITPTHYLSGKSQQSRCRVRCSSSGFSLVTVTGLGIVTMLWLYAFTASVLPMYMKASQARFLSVVRSSAEAGLDYAVSQLNASINSEGVITSPLDDGATYAVPSDAIGNSGAAVTVTVTNSGPPTSSAVYNSQYDGPYPNTVSGVQENGWRVVTAVATYANLTKTIRVILEPQYGPPNNSSTELPYFQYALFGQSKVTLSNNAYTDAYSNGIYGGSNINRINGSIGTNANPAPSGVPISMGNNASVGGNVDIHSLPLGSTSYATITANNNAKIWGDVNSNGLTSGIAGGTVQGTINSSQSNPQVSLPTPLTVPTDSVVVAPSYTVSGNSTWVAQPQPGQVVNLGTISLSNNKTMYLPPGDYQLNSLSLSNNSNLTLQPGSSGYGIVRLFFNGTVSGTNVIQMGNNSNMNNNSQNPGMLQIWYNGAKTVALSNNAALYAVIYAPNAAVNTSNNGHIYGSVVGKTLNFSNNAGYHFDERLLNTTLSTTPTYTSSGGVQVQLTSLRTISWQEL